MEILFPGICLFDTMHSSPSIIGLMPNGTAGMQHDGHTIPPHEAFILANPGEVDFSEWGSQPVTVMLDGAPRSLFSISGDEISFDPPPAGGSADITLLTRPPCAIGKQVREDLVGANPPAASLIMRTVIPSAANFDVVLTSGGANIARLVVAGGTELVSVPFGGAERRLKFIGDPMILIANVVLDMLLSGVGDDTDHDHLFCPMFEDPPSPSAPEAIRRLVTTSFALEVAQQLEKQFVLERRKPPQAKGIPVTLGSGCSNSQWP